MVVDNVAERRVIRTGYAEGGQIEVLEGLDDSEVFVIVGHTSLKNGSKVSIINAVESGESAASADTT